MTQGNTPVWLTTNSFEQRRCSVSLFTVGAWLYLWSLEIEETLSLNEIINSIVTDMIEANCDFHIFQYRMMSIKVIKANIFCFWSTTKRVIPEYCDPIHDRFHVHYEEEITEMKSNLQKIKAVFLMCSIMEHIKNTGFIFKGTSMHCDGFLSF